MMEATDCKKEQRTREEKVNSISNIKCDKNERIVNMVIPYIRQELAPVHVSGGSLLGINQIGTQYNWHYVKLSSFQGQIL